MHRAVLIASLFTCTMVMALAQPERPRLPLQTASTAELPVRMQLTNDMTIELLGRCLIYSVSYQRMVFPRLGLEGGFAALGGSDASLLFFSAGARLYLTESNISPYIAGGGVFGKASLKKIFIAEEVSACRGFINPGFEYRASGGFVFRGGVYLLFLDEGFSLWPGIQMGVAF